MPKRYIDENHLRLGDIVELDEPVAKQRNAVQEIVSYAIKKGSIQSIKDPVSWQREQRNATNPWEIIETEI